MLPEALGGYTIGVLVQTNYGGTLVINGAPVGRELGTYAYSGELQTAKTDGDKEDGSIMIVVATDAPLNARSLDRLAQRAIMGLARTGSYASNGSGDYVIAFSTHPSVRKPRISDTPVKEEVLVNASMSPLFAATAEATEEAIYNAIFKATTVTSSRGELRAIPIEDLQRILKKYGVLNWKNPPPQKSAPGRTLPIPVAEGLECPTLVWSRSPQGRGLRAYMDVLAACLRHRSGVPRPCPTRTPKALCKPHHPSSQSSPAPSQ